MKAFSVLFQEANSPIIDYQGRTVYRFLKCNEPGNYKIIVRSVTSNSDYIQAFIIGILNLNGTVSINGKLYPKPKGKFPQVIIPEQVLASDINIDIVMNVGSFTMFNGADPFGTGKYFRSLTFGSAIIVTKLDDGWYRVNCNDFENDDDFDDFIFDIKIEKDGSIISIYDDCIPTK